MRKGCIQPAAVLAFHLADFFIKPANKTKNKGQTLLLLTSKKIKIMVQHGIYTKQANIFGSNNV
jgi:hypothetical protein